MDDGNLFSVNLISSVEKNMLLLLVYHVIGLTTSKYINFKAHIIYKVTLS